MPTTCPLPLEIFHWEMFVEMLLKSFFADSFPDAVVKIDKGFLAHVEQESLQGLGGRNTHRSFVIEEGTEGVDRACARELKPCETLSLVKYLGTSAIGLEIDEAETPQKENGEVERNLVLGLAYIDGRACLLYIEHEWKNVDGVVKREIHLHARPTERQTWNEEDQVSVVVLS